MRTNRSENQIYTGRLLPFYGIMLVVIGFYVFRLFSLQILDGKEMQERAYENRHSTLRTATTRGVIYDRNGIVLARNVASYNVVITPAELPEDEGNAQVILRELSALINVPAVGPEPDEQIATNFTPCITEQLAISQIVYIQSNLRPYTPVPIVCNVDEKTARIVREKSADWPGVSVEVQPIREYPTGQLTSEVIGFLGPIPADSEDIYPGMVPGRDKVGYAGIEASMQAVLGGQNGVREIEVDVAGKVLGDLAVPIDPIPGDNLRLTIDTRLQAVAKAALEEQIAYLHAKQPEVQEDNGVVMAMNVKTGEILAFVSHPTFENNRMARIIPAYYYNQLERDPNRPLFNHAISAEHAPGSVFKMAAALGILNEGVVTPELEVDDPGKIYLTERYYENDPGTPRPYYCYTWQTGGHGEHVDFLRGVSESCDVYFYKVGGGFPGQVEGGGLGIWRLGEYARALGWGLTTGIELPGEQDGMIPDPDWKRLVIGENWSTGDTYIATIGQGYVLSTPFQVLRAFQTLANDGVMVRPTLIKEVLDQEGHIITAKEPEVICDITGECPLRCNRETQKCEIDTLGLCDLASGQCKLTSDPDDDRIDPDYYPSYGGVINILDDNGDATGEHKPVAPWVIQKAKESMREVVIRGTASKIFEGSVTSSGIVIESAGKTGTAEYCDNVAQLKDICKQGHWPAHAWYAGYAPYDNPEIVVMAFIYHGQEGSVFAAPVARMVMEAYFELKALDSSGGAPSAPAAPPTAPTLETAPEDVVEPAP